MQYLTITRDMTLWQLINIVGEQNIDAILNANGLERAYNIGEQFYARVESLGQIEDPVSYQTKLDILNKFVGDSDIYEKAALGDDFAWMALSVMDCFPDAIKIPEDVELPSAVGILGNGIPIDQNIHNKCRTSLLSPIGPYPHTIDSTIFSNYDATYYGGAYVTDSDNPFETQLYQEFKFPWKEVFLYSSMSDEILYFPVYPKEISYDVTANYEEMPEMLYQYEPWKVYKSSGPREINFTFEFHRDMWTGDHRDGMANNLIRGCQANCYPHYDGALVHTALVSMYVHGQNLITGIMTDCKVEWSGPIGLDGFYLCCTLSISITEISPEPLNYTAVRYKRLIQ